MSVKAIQEIYLIRPKKPVCACVLITPKQDYVLGVRNCSYCLLWNWWINPNDLCLLGLLHEINITEQFLQKIVFSEMWHSISEEMFIALMSKYWLLKVFLSTFSMNVTPSKVKVWCGLMHGKLINSFFFVKQTILTCWNCTPCHNFHMVVSFQHDGIPPHYANIVLEFLDTYFCWWIDRVLSITGHHNHWIWCPYNFT